MYAQAVLACGVNSSVFFRGIRVLRETFGKPKVLLKFNLSLSLQVLSPVHSCVSVVDESFLLILIQRALSNLRLIPISDLVRNRQG